jgi:hypothetical protein
VADYEQALQQVASDPAQSLLRASKLQKLIQERHRMVWLCEGGG